VVFGIFVKEPAIRAWSRPIPEAEPAPNIIAAPVPAEVVDAMFGDLPLWQQAA
jgi:hypothetical protein